MIIIPIGVDCGIANILKKYKLRNYSLPFDWVVSYTGVSKCIYNDFNLFTNPLNLKKNMYDIYFLHDNMNNDTEKYERRIQRFKNILETTNEKIIFCRKGHSCYHHNEHNIVANEIEEAENLNVVISQKFPSLKYKIILLLMCGNCINHNEKITSSSPNIDIHNISNFDINIPSPNDDHNLCEKIMCDIFKLN